MSSDNVPVQQVSSSVSIPSDFKIREVDGITERNTNNPASKSGDDATSRRLKAADDQVPVGPGPVLPTIPPLPNVPRVEGALGVLNKFVGSFKGHGLNTIFRPNSVGSGLTDNLLEFNLTSETLAFMKDIGDVPNRGFAGQPDVMLKAVPYTQTIDDVLNPATGKGDLPTPVAIHFEQGLFVRTPHTENPKIDVGTISRMGSIPHGTTIAAQSFEPADTPIQGAPQIKSLSFLPFTIGGNPTADAVTAFDNTRFAPTQLRIPQDLTLFAQSGAITEEIFNNPNQLLNDANKNSSKKSIKEHFHFKVTTKGTDALPGGGTATIAFLQGPNLTSEEAAQTTPPAKGNANAVRMTCEYWISTVQYDVVIPKGHWGQANQAHQGPAKSTKKLLTPEATKVDGVKAPKFLVELDKNVTKDTIIKLEATQIQYSQEVLLDFGPLSWPHVSVNTLLPAAAVFVPAESPALANLK